MQEPRIAGSRKTAPTDVRIDARISSTVAGTTNGAPLAQFEPRRESVPAGPAFTRAVQDAAARGWHLWRSATGQLWLTKDTQNGGVTLAPPRLDLVTYTICSYERGRKGQVAA